jgi:hypothetical protein
MKRRGTVRIDAGRVALALAIIGLALVSAPLPSRSQDVDAGPAEVDVLESLTAAVERAAVTGVSIAEWLDTDELISVIPDVGEGTRDILSLMMLSVVPPPGQQSPGENSCSVWALEAAASVLSHRTDPLDQDAVRTRYRRITGGSSSAVTLRTAASQYMSERTPIALAIRMGRPGISLSELVSEIVAVLRQSQAVAITIPVDDAFMRLAGAGPYQSPRCRPCSRFHSMLVVGYDPARGPSGSLRVLNSYGSTWGEHGQAWLDTRSFLSDRVEVFAVLDEDHVDRDVVDAGDCGNISAGAAHLALTPNWTRDDLGGVWASGLLEMHWAFDAPRGTFFEVRGGSVRGQLATGTCPAGRRCRQSGDVEVPFDGAGNVAVTVRMGPGDSASATGVEIVEASCTLHVDVSPHPRP